MLNYPKFLSSGRFCHCLPTPSEMAELDRSTIAAGIPSLELMERASQSIFRACCEEIFLKRLGRLPRDAVVLCGPGNNGGDGAVVARLLFEQGVQTTLLLSTPEPKTEELQINLARAKDAGCRIGYFLPGGNTDSESLSASQLSKLFQESECVFDALLGVGQKSAPRGAMARLLELLRESASQALMIAIDLPTGIDGESGSLFSPHFQADSTVAVECLKRGMSQYPAREACGEMIVVGAGIESGSVPKYQVALPQTLPSLSRTSDSNKGNFAKVFLVAGSAHMPGAATLAANAAVFSGAGLVTRVSFEQSKQGGVDSSMLLPECLLSLLPYRKGGTFQKKDCARLIERLPDRGSALVLGPGMSVTRDTRAFLRELLSMLTSRFPSVVVLDADALNVLAEEPKACDLLEPLPVVLTPHPGEASRLLRRSVAEVQSSRFQALEELLKRYRAKAVVLKGASTVVAGEQSRFVVLAGNPFMATGGMGDVLSGMIATFSSEKGLERGPALAAYLHARAADRIVIKRGAGPIPPSALIQEIPGAYSELLSGQQREGRND